MDGGDRGRRFNFHCLFIRSWSPVTAYATCKVLPPRFSCARGLLGSQSVEDLNECQLPAGVTPGPAGVSVGGRSRWHGGALSVLVGAHARATVKVIPEPAMLAGEWGSSKGSWRPEASFLWCISEVLGELG